MTSINFSSIPVVDNVGADHEAVEEVIGRIEKSGDVIDTEAEAEFLAQRSQGLTMPDARKIVLAVCREVGKVANHQTEKRFDKMGYYTESIAA